MSVMTNDMVFQRCSMCVEICKFDCRTALLTLLKPKGTTFVILDKCRHLWNEHKSDMNERKSEMNERKSETDIFLCQQIIL